MSALLKLSYSDTHVNELAILIMGDIILVILFVLLIVSYAGIVSSILKVPLLEVSVKPFLPVVPTCLWYHCSMGQSSDNSKGDFHDYDEHSGDSYVEPLHLQSMEQRHEDDPS